MPRPRTSSVNLNDIAAATGFGRATVARALAPDNRYPLTPQTRATIQAAATRLGYRPKWSGRVLSHGKSRQIGLLYAGEALHLAGALSELINAVPRALTQAGYTLVHVPLSGDDPEAWLERLDDGSLDGGLVMPPMPFPLTRLPRIPLVLVNLDGPPTVAKTLADDAAGTRLALDHLAGLGHRQIAFHHGPVRTQHISTEVREATYRTWCAEQGCSPVILLEEPTATATRCAQGARPTAILCYNHVHAVDLLGRLQERGLRVPGDISLMTFNDTWPTAVTNPPLSVVAVPMRAMGVQAVRHLLALIDQPSNDPPPTLLLPETLVLRASTGPALPPPAGP